MDQPLMLESRPVAAGTRMLGAYLPVPGQGILPVNAFVIGAEQPVLIDTGLAALREDFMAQLETAVDLTTLRWIWLTHMDPDHVGNLRAVLERAPRAQVVTSFLGAGKMGLLQLPVERVHLLEAGQRLDVGDRELLAIAPPCFDAPETLGVFDTRTRALFSADCFGALMQQPVETAADIAPGDLREGLATWSMVDAPWLRMVQRDELALACEPLRGLDPERVLGSHLPPAVGMLAPLTQYLLATAGGGQRGPVPANGQRAG